jgi:hypothetical protein
MTDTVSHRCGRLAKHGSPCRTPVAVSGGVCASHRPALQGADSALKTTQDLVASFVENYTCQGCEASVELVRAGQAQLILVSHDSTCPLIVARVKRVAA